MLEDVFHNMHALQNEIKKPNGLETLLLNAVMQRKPAQGVAMFWNTVTEKLGINQIPIRTQSGAISAETWSPEYFWTMPGIKVENSQGNTLYFAGNGTRPEIYGFRAGSRASVDALGLTPTTETSALAQAATPVVPTTTPTANSRLVTAPLPSPTSMTYAYGNTSASPNSANASRGLSVPTPKADKLDAPPSAPKRSKSPFSGFKLPGLRRGACPAPIATS